MTDYAIWNELGLLHLSSGALNQAIHAYQSAIKENETYLPARLNLARAHVRNEDFVEAEKTYFECLNLRLDDDEKADVWTQLSQLYTSIDREIAAQNARDKAEALRATTQPDLTGEAKNDPSEGTDETHPKDGLASAMEKSARKVPFAQVKLEDIYINPQQPRMRIDVETLVESVREHGILQPILISPNGDEGHYILISGHRRLEAAKQIGLATIPAVIREVDESKRLELALTENLQRRNLSSLEQADAYAQLCNEFKLSVEEVARRMGKSSITVKKMLRQLELPERIKRALDAGRIEDGHAQAILQLKDTEKQLNLLDQIMQYNLSVRKAEALARLLDLDVEHAFDAPQPDNETVAESDLPQQETMPTESQPEPPETDPLPTAELESLIESASVQKTHFEKASIDAEDTEADLPSFDKDDTPNEETDWQTMAEAYAKDGDTAKAISICHTVLQEEPGNASTHEKLGHLYVIDERYNEATESFQQALEADPTNIFIHCALASTYRRMGMEDEANTHIEIVAPQMGQKSAYNQACFEAICGNVVKAVEFLEIALADDVTTREMVDTDLDFDFIRQEERFIEFLQTSAPVV